MRGDEARAVPPRSFSERGTRSVRDEESAVLLRAIGVEAGRDRSRSGVDAAHDADRARDRYPALAGRGDGAGLRDWPFDRGWEDAFVTAYGDALPRDWACLWGIFPASDATPSGRSITRSHRVSQQVAGITHVIWDGVRLQDAQRGPGAML